MGIITILWEKWVEFRRDFYKITLAAMIAPMMYLLVFGLGVQNMSHGKPYLLYLIPGVVSLTTMNGSFNAIAQNLNVQRLYEKAFDQVMISPTPLWQFVVGQILAGALRGLYAGGIILLLVWPIHTGLIFNALSFLVLFLNGCVFSVLGVVVSFLAKNHADVPRFSTYFIMPMAYLCNTFFSTENMPRAMRSVLAVLPLSETSSIVRSISYGEPYDPAGILVLLAYLVVLTAVGLWFVYRKQNL
ncbi:MAG: ABC transporter permease [Eubacteriales bacterium]|nr:ABC transporter permease [Eubacteriales bacterium]